MFVVTPICFISPNTTGPKGNDSPQGLPCEVNIVFENQKSVIYEKKDKSKRMFQRYDLY